MNYGNIKFQGENKDVVQLHFRGTVQPLLLAGFDIQSGRNLQKFVLRLQLGYSIAGYEGEGLRDYAFVSKEAVTYSIKQKLISPSFSFLYNFYRSNKLKMYFGGAGSYNFASTENTYTSTNPDTGIKTVRDNFIDFEKAWIGVNLKTGALINNKFEIAASGDISRTLTNYSYFSASASCYALSVNYHF